MNNEAIAVKCTLHGPQIVRERQSSIIKPHTQLLPSGPWDREGRMHYVTRKINY